MSNQPTKSLIRTLLEKQILGEIEVVNARKPHPEELKSEHVYQVLYHSKVVAKKGDYVVVKVVGEKSYPTFGFFKNPVIKNNKVLTVDAWEGTPEAAKYSNVEQVNSAFDKLYPNNDPIGIIELGFDTSPKVSGVPLFPYVYWVEVLKSEQGSGLSFVMYDFVIDYFGGLWSGDAQSPGSRNAWAKLALNKKYYVLAYNAQDKSFHNVGVQAQTGAKKKSAKEEVFPWSEEFPLYYDTSKGTPRDTPTKKWSSIKKSQDNAKKTMFRFVANLSNEFDKQSKYDNGFEALIDSLPGSQKRFRYLPGIQFEPGMITISEYEEIDEDAKFIIRYASKFKENYSQLLVDAIAYHKNFEKFMDFMAKAQDNKNIRYDLAAEPINNRMFACKVLPKGVANRVMS